MKYLASPYSHPDAAVRQKRFEATEDALVWLLQKSIWAYSPIVMCHELAQKHELRTDHEFWLAFDTDMLRRSDELLVLELDGWRVSKGVNYGLQLARTLHLPVTAMTPLLGPEQYFLWSAARSPLDPPFVPAEQAL